MPTVKYPKDKDQVGKFFAAWGFHTPLENFSARLRQITKATTPTTTQSYIYGTHLYTPAPKLWIITFSGLEKGAVYDLEIFDASGKIVERVLDLKVKQNSGGATIDDPLSGDVEPTFVAQGETDDGTSTMGCCALYPDSGAPISAMPTVIDSFWVASFESVPSGDYQLRVSAEGGDCASPDATADLTVKAGP